VFQKGYLPNWTEEIFEIAEKHPTYPMTYGLKDLAGEDIKGKFYEQEIQKVVKTDDVYEIEKILKTRKRGVKSNTSLSGKVIRKNSTVGGGGVQT
jgi:hypothetical protein